MKKYGITLLVCCFLSALAQAGDYAHLYQNLPEPQVPQIPATRVSLPDFGGCADGIGLNTDAFRKAVSALEKQGGGHLDVPAGIWLTGPIGLKSRIDLHLERGAIILFTPEKEAFLKDGKMVPGITASKRED
ncbi:MAG: glycoside hydrolase family 28 protein, partial [Bacteroidales bacterium]|nr:glycoside hydrolase family 28 protein [Bacteroidales bacterium]